MIDILSHLKNEHAAFRAGTPVDAIALHLAKELNDEPAARSYAQLIANYGLPAVIAAYRGLPSRPAKPPQAYRLLRHQLEAGIVAVSLQEPFPVVGVAVERRTVAAAIFENGSLVYTMRRELAAEHSRALKSTYEFACRVFDRHSQCTVALEDREQGQDTRRTQLAATIRTIVRETGVPLWPVDKSRLYAGFTYPACATRKALREAVNNIWRSLRPHAQKSTILDAVAVGFHAFSERLLSARQGEERDAVAEAA